MKIDWDSLKDSGKSFSSFPAGLSRLEDYFCFINVQGPLEERNWKRIWEAVSSNQGERGAELGHGNNEGKNLREKCISQGSVFLV